jgi:hypothetical protein
LEKKLEYILSKEYHDVVIGAVGSRSGCGLLVLCGGKKKGLQDSVGLIRCSPSFVLNELKFLSGYHAIVVWPGEAEWNEVKLLS